MTNLDAHSTDRSKRTQPEAAAGNARLKATVFGLSCPALQQEFNQTDFTAVAMHLMDALKFANGSPPRKNVHYWVAAVLIALCLSSTLHTMSLPAHGTNCHAAVPRRKVVLEWDVYRPELMNAADDLKTVQRKAANNIGNWVWSYAARTRLIDTTQVDVIRESETNLPAAYPNQQAIDVLIWPTANILLNESYGSHMREFLDGLTGTFERLHATNTSILVIGIGIDHQLQPRAYAIKDLGDRLDRLAVPSDMVMYKPAVEMLRAVSKTAPVIGVRGAYTAAVCKNHGITKAEALGCPSLFLSMHARAGEVLAKKIRDLSSKPRLAITLPHIFRPKLMTFLLRLFFENDASIIVIQDTRDFATLETAARELGIKVPMDRTRFFYNFEQWMEDICKFDAIVGGRIHGSMIGLVCPIPMLVVPLDMRIEELVTLMKIPHLRMDHPVFFGNHSQLSVKDLFDAYDFDAEAFDKNRYRQAWRYVQHFNSMGLPPSVLLRTLASMHVEPGPGDGSSI